MSVSPEGRLLQHAGPVSLLQLTQEQISWGKLAGT